MQDKVEMAAEMAHEANRVLQRRLGEGVSPPWAAAPGFQRESTIKGVVFTRDTPGATAEDSHKSWLREKERTGWAYGPVKDESAKRHPCCVPYSDLPPGQQLKDHLFRAIVTTVFRAEL